MIFERLCRFLDDRGLPYAVSEHAEAFSAEEAAAHRGTELAAAAKALVLQIRGRGFVLLVVPAHQKLGSKALRHGLKASRIRFATRDELFELTDLRPGCVPPFGEPILPLPLFIDASFAARQDNLVFTAGRHDRSITIKVRDYLAAAGGELVALTKDQ